MPSAVRITATVITLASLVLVGCAGDRNAFTDPFASRPAAAPKPAAPPINMTGRWLLAGPDGKSCGMNFTAAPGAQNGKIAPEGGCPGNFFTSRQWAFDQGALVIYDHKEQPLARLASSDPSRFQGNATNGAAMTLSR
jgi:hypothetical protein